MHNVKQAEMGGQGVLCTNISPDLRRDGKKEGDGLGLPATITNCFCPGGWNAIGAAHGYEKEVGCERGNLKSRANSHLGRSHLI